VDYFEIASNGVGAPFGDRLRELALAHDAPLDLLQVLEQLVPLALALLGEGVVLADDEALAGKVRAGDLGEIALVEQRQLQGATFGGELLNLRRLSVR
jgi:hypothetical protein